MCVCVCVCVCARVCVCVCVCVLPICNHLIHHIGYSTMLKWNQVCREEVRLCVCMYVSFCGFIVYCSFFSCSEYRLKY